MQMVAMTTWIEIKVIYYASPLIQVQIGILKFNTNGKTMNAPNVIDDYQCYINICILVVSFLLISIRIRKTSEENMIFVNISLML